MMKSQCTSGLKLLLFWNGQRINSKCFSKTEESNSMILRLYCFIATCFDLVTCQTAKRHSRKMSLAFIRTYNKLFLQFLYQIMLLAVTGAFVNHLQRFGTKGSTAGYLHYGKRAKNCRQSPIG